MFKQDIKWTHQNTLLTNKYKTMNNDLEKIKDMFASQSVVDLRNKDQLKQSSDDISEKIKSHLHSYDNEVRSTKDLRRRIDVVIQDVKSLPASRETSISITKLQEAVMWLGMNLKRLGEANPYPSSKDPSTGTKIEPTADGLKF